jgi:hypothetical protein
MPLAEGHSHIGHWQKNINVQVYFLRLVVPDDVAIPAKHYQEPYAPRYEARFE